MAAQGQPMDDTQFRAWKTQLVPLLYDWFSHHNLTWPSQACRWGRQLEDAQYRSKSRVYISEQTDNPQAEPPKLIVLDVDLVKPRVAATEVVATWSELARCPYIKETKTIIHPGEVNKIREVAECPDVVVTHTDAPELYVWNTATQPHMTKEKGKEWGESVADAKLVGHEKDAQFPLATCKTAPLVASGGEDKLVLLWDLRDVQDSLLAKRDKDAEKPTTVVEQRQKLKGHKKTVEDLVFQPNSTTSLVSVGDDAQVLFWDTTSGNSPIAAVKESHGACDVHTVDWNGLREHLVVTGAADGSLKVWDRRKLPASGADANGAVHVYNYHTEAIMRVEWHPTEAAVFASGGEDHLVVIWSLDRAQAAAGGASSSKSVSRDAPSEVLFKHVGHRAGKVVDFQWCPDSPWTMMSVSDNTIEGEQAEGAKSGGGTLQLWRISDLLYRPEEEVVKELEEHREWILTGREATRYVKRPKQHQDKQEKQAAAAAAASGGAASAGTSSEGKDKAKQPAAAAAVEESGSGQQVEQQDQQQQQQVGGDAMETETATAEGGAAALEQLLPAEPEAVAAAPAATADAAQMETDS